jgi:glutamate-1-semialdehyde-2,1-aminomutase
MALLSECPARPPPNREAVGTFRSPLPSAASNLLEVIDLRARESPRALAFTFDDGGDELLRLTYEELKLKAQSLAARLQDVTRPGDTALLVYPQSLDFITAFWGCLYAGVIAVPMYPPKLSRSDSRLQAIARDSGAKVALTSEAIFNRLERRLEHAPELGGLSWLNSSRAPAASSPLLAVPAPSRDSLAFLQYTSGSTATPRGVMVSHGNLLTNMEDLDRGYRHTRDSIMVSWLPLYHDMGLIYGTLTPIYKGFPCHLMAPASVLQNPLRWLEAISRHRATHSGAPNFAYDLCARAIPPHPPQRWTGLDLSSWTMALNGAEPIRPETLAAFTAAFQDYGFAADAFCPGYGLAEATLKVTSIRADQPPVFFKVNREALEKNRFQLAGDADLETARLVSCGASEVGTRIQIVNPRTLKPCRSTEIGEIWVAGDTVAQGYWRRPEDTKETFEAFLAGSGEGPFLRTGDLGFLADGGLVVTGRIKDLLILQGLNHYPSDIEATVSQCHGALRRGAAAAFSVTVAGEERLVIAQEVERTALRGLNLAALVGAVCGAVAEHHDLQVYALALLRPMSLPKTSSGKVRRRACRAAYLADRLRTVGSWARRLDDLPPAAEPEPAAGPAGPSLAARRIEAWLVERLARQLGVDVADLDVAEPMARYGLGSQDAVRLSASLAGWLGRPVPPTIAYDHPTIAALAAHLAAPLAGDSGVKIAGRTTPILSGEPIAVIGIGCRFPQAEGPDAFWELLRNGVDAISEVPPERRRVDAHGDADPERPGRMGARLGGFLRGVDRFDAAFFGISPHEAERMDPQQRLLLEVAWEALENAGIPADRLAGQPAGVFIGVSANDYARFQTSDPALIDGYAGTGNALSMIANRLSYVLDLRGPSLTLDTACSSSLVALHQACLSLRLGECHTALAGGVNLTLTPHWTIAFSQAGMLAADGRCKTFDAAADGYVRGEGCGLVVLRRLRDALADGDRPLAVIRGSAVNQDGRSNGLTAPSRHAQQEVMIRALEQAGLPPGAIGYIEAHGTGTALGDPIEVNALKSLLLAARPPPEQRCALGSVKTNIGHLEAAAGIAGLIKTVLALHHELIPPHLHLERLNDQIDLAGTPLYVPDRAVPWPRTAVPRRAGVSSFGFGGTNAHVILEEAPIVHGPPAARPDRAWHVLTLSAKSEPALGELARRYDELLLPDRLPLADVCYSANIGRAHLPYGAAILADSPAALGQGLRALAAGQNRPGLHRGRAPRRPPKVAFLFTGQGSQYSGMGRRLYDTQPAFRAVMERSEPILQQAAGFSLLGLLFADVEDAADGRLSETCYAQPALFALQAALLELWRSWGVVPDAVLGHSSGEYAAAYAAGMFGLEEGLRLLAARGRLMQEAPGPGAMAMVFAAEARVRRALAPYAGRVAVAAINGPEQVVISGAAATVREVVSDLEAGGVKTHGLEAAHGFHSPLMAPLAGPFARVLEGIDFRPAALPLVADLSGELVVSGERLDAGYWLRHLCEPVQFAAGIERLVAEGHDLFVEIGPSATLSALARRCVGKDAAMTWLPSLLQGRNPEHTMLDTLAALHVRGMPADWHAFDAQLARRRLDLPTYPFQRESYWFDAPTRRDVSLEAGMQSPIVPSERRAKILADLLAVSGRLMGLSPAAIDPEVPFLDLGADSIVLVNLIRILEKSYSLELPIRLLFERIHSLSQLAVYLDEHAGSVLPSVPAETAVPTDVLPGLAGSETGLIMQRQLDLLSQVMNQQLAILSGTPASGRREPAAHIAEQPAFSTGRLEETGRVLEPRQRRYVQALAQRLCRQTPSSRDYADQHRPRWADLRMSLTFRRETKEMCYPIVGERSQGAQVWDKEGNAYVDLSMGFGINLFGHNPPFVMAALRAQMERGLHVGIQSDLAGEAASLIAELTGMERVTFCNSGTEAVMTAIRLARAVTGRVRIVQFSGSYHGHADPTLAVARPGQEAGSAPMAAGVPEATSDQVIVLPYGEERALRTIEAHLGELAAVLVEPVQSRRPDLQPAAFLKRLRELTRNAGVPLIFDEVITGFRCHPGGAQAYFGIEADLATYGKALGGGMPIGVVAGKRRFLDAVDGGGWRYGDDSVPAVETTFVAGTFCKHPLAMAAALAVLRHLKAAGPALQEDLNRRTAKLAGTLNGVFRAADVPIEVAHFASLFHFVYAKAASYVYEPLEADLFFHSMIANGVYIWEGRTCFLSTAHTEEEVRKIADAARRSVMEMKAAGFFAEDRPAAGARPLRVPLSAAQKQLWLLSRVDPGGSLAYTVPVRLELRGQLDAAALGRALRRVVVRHEALRTVLDGDGEHQTILPEAGVELSVIDLRSGPDAEAALAAWSSAERERPFELVGLPLFRAHLIALTEGRHVLALAAHHLVVDGWSMGVIVKDLMRLYAEEAHGSAAGLAEPLQWRDYLRWLEQQEPTPAMAEHEAYWVARCEGASPELNLPADRPRPASKSYRGGRVTALLEEDLVQALRALGREQVCTLFMTLFAAWSSFLERLTDQGDLTIGVPVAGRPPPAEETVGYCSHLLPIRVLAEDETTFTQHLTRTRETLLAAYQHQDYPFARLIQKLQLAPDPSRTPLLATAFNLERPVHLTSIPGLEVVLAPQPVGYTGFDLHFNAMELGGTLSLELDYATDLFEHETADRLLRGFKIWLRAAAAAPDTPLDRLPTMAATERHQIVIGWNSTGTPHESFAGIHEAISLQAGLRPEAPAVVFGDDVLSYRELEERANRLAHFLIAHGVTQSMLVGLCIPRSPAMIVGLLGILKAGAAYVPLEPSLPHQRLALILEDAAIHLIVTLESTASALPKGNWATVLLDAEQATIARQPHAQPVRPVGPRDAAYVIYTSGSTGRPKGVVVEHGAVCNLAHAQRKLFAVRPESRVLQFANLGFDASVSEIFVTLAAGARLHLANQDDLLPGPTFVDLLSRERITLVTLPPSVLSALPAVDLPHLETVVSAGEACTPEVVSRWAGKHRLINAYGPTEACVCATGTVSEAGGAALIGQPIDNVQVYALDRHGEPVPVGMVGELHIGGAQVARGYLHRPDLTAAAFLPDPFGEPGGRIYRTGDLARYHADGRIEYLGRRDRQIKLRGFRVELGEIEHALRRCPGVREAAVVLRHQRLIAYLVLDPPQPTLAHLRDLLADALPAYMAPADFMVLDALPLNANGKLDGDRLPETNGSPSRGQVEYVAPRNLVEERIAAIWQEVLGIERVGIRDTFVALGGHSLLSIQIASRIEEAFGVRISLKVLFTGKSLEVLARDVETALLANSSLADLEKALESLEAGSDGAIEHLLAEA